MLYSVFKVHGHRPFHRAAVNRFPGLHHRRLYQSVNQFCRIPEVPLGSPALPHALSCRISPAGRACRLSLLVGLSGLEPPTSRLSGVRSNRLSYKPIFPGRSASFFVDRSLRLTSSFSRIVSASLREPSESVPPYLGSFPLFSSRRAVPADSVRWWR